MRLAEQGGSRGGVLEREPQNESGQVMTYTETQKRIVQTLKTYITKTYNKLSEIDRPTLSEHFCAELQGMLNTYLTYYYEHVHHGLHTLSDREISMIQDLIDHESSDVSIASLEHGVALLYSIFPYDETGNEDEAAKNYCIELKGIIDNYKAAA